METPTFLYKPNFCAECGEKIERDAWHFWTSRSFCDNCEPVFRATRLIPAAVAAAVLFFGGMFFSQMGQIGQIGQKTPKPVMLASNSSQPAAKAQAAIPQQFTATDQPTVRQNAANSENSPVNNANNSNKTGANNIRTPAANAAAVPVTGAVFICGARTQKGTPCSRRVKAPGRCWQHLGRPSLLEKAN